MKFSLVSSLTKSQTPSSSSQALLVCCHPHRIYYVQLFLPFQMVIALLLSEGTFANRRKFCVHNILLSAQTMFMCWNIEKYKYDANFASVSCAHAVWHNHFIDLIAECEIHVVNWFWIIIVIILCRFDSFIVFLSNFYKKKMVAILTSADLSKSLQNNKKNCLLNWSFNWLPFA